MKIAIIGGGASGMTAALTARESGASVTIFERMDRVGKKLLSTGNGRCNITNKNVLEEKDGNLIHYYSDQPDFPRYALYNFNHLALLNEFSKLGVLFRCEDGKYYPYSETASTILDVMRLRCERVGVKTICGAKIEQISKNSMGFDVCGEKFDRVIVAVGGSSSPHLGTDGSGYELLEMFGHHHNKIRPAITQIRTDNTLTRQLKGIKVYANVTLKQNSKVIRKDYGQVMFADYGISGPPVFQLSSGVRDGEKFKISLDLMPEFTHAEIHENIRKIIDNPFCNDLKADNLLSPMINKKVGQIIVKYCQIPLSTSADNLSAREIDRLVTTLKSFDLEVLGTKGFQNAQVTAGGILTKDFDNHTMESRLCKGLFACGEVLDVTGDCGGYNLQWAFSSGVMAGKAAVL